MGQINLEDHVAFDLERTGPEAPALVTHGMVKFGLPELVLRGVPDDLAQKGEVLLAYMASQLGSWAAPLRNGFDWPAGPSQARSQMPPDDGSDPGVSRHGPVRSRDSPRRRDDTAHSNDRRRDTWCLDSESFLRADRPTTRRLRSAA